MDKAEQAYEAARAEIARVKAERVDTLDLYGNEFRDLRLLPPEIAELTNLVFLDLHGTHVADLTPIAGMTGLQELFLDGSKVMDLTPLAGLIGLQALNLDNTQITDLAPLAGLTRLQRLHLHNTQIADLAPLAGLTGLQTLTLNSTQITDLAPLAGVTGLQTLYLSNTEITDLAPLAGLTDLQGLNLDTTQITDLRPIAALTKLREDIFLGLTFRNTPATARDAKLAELAEIEDPKDRARQTLAYLRSLPPWPDPYTPAATPDGSPPKPIGGDALVEQAEALSEKTPLAEELVQDPETGIFSVRHKVIEKPDLLSATLWQVADAIEDVLHDPSNGLNEGSLEIRKLHRTLDRYANDPQRVEMDFTTIHQSLTRQVANEDLPPSEAILGLMSTLQDAAQGIRATDPAVAVNRKILQEQKLREMPAEAFDTLRDGKPVLTAIMGGEAQEQMDEDVSDLVENLQTIRPQLAGVTRDDAIMPGRDEAVRVFGRVARMVIMLRKSPETIRKLHQSTGFKAAEIMAVLGTLIALGLSIF